jgi:hypothetical protein
MSWINTITTLLGFGQYNATAPEPEDEELVSFQLDDDGNLKVSVVANAWGLPAVYAVSGSWPSVVAAHAVLQVATAPAAALTMPIYMSWIVMNAASGAVMIDGHVVAAKAAELLQTDSTGALTVTALGTVA